MRFLLFTYNLVPRFPTRPVLECIVLIQICILFYLTKLGQQDQETRVSQQDQDIRVSQQDQDTRVTQQDQDINVDLQD